MSTDTPTPWNLVRYKGRLWHDTGLRDHRGHWILNRVHPDHANDGISAPPADVRPLSPEEHERQTKALCYFWQ